MIEAEYEYECSRAELLGLPRPDRNEFFSRQREIVNEGSDEEMSMKEAEEGGVRREEFQRIGGGLEELNSILSSTQRKLNRFKTVCGSLGNLLKLQVGAKKEENVKPVDPKSESHTGGEKEESGETSMAISRSPKAQNKKEGNVELDKLDSLISKAEKAELSLCSQNKQMKKFLN